MPDTLHEYVKLYIKALGWAVVPLLPNKKYPTRKGWQDSPLTTYENLPKVFYEGSNVGLLHSESRTSVLDVDHIEWARLAFAAVGIDLDALLAAPGPKIRSAKGLKPLYRLPDGLELTRKVLTWHEPGAEKPTTVFELRAGKVQDVLPPSIHPDTGKPYTWEPSPPQNRKEIPILPDCLRMLWENW